MKEPFHKGFVVFSVLNCGISFAQWGYFFTLFNTLQSHFQNHVFPDATVNEISMIGSSPNFGGAIGVLLAESLVTKLGRWKTMVITDIIVLFGVCLTMVASLPILVAGRTVVGFAIGIASVAVPLYITEMTPVEYRGATGVFPAIGSCITRILSYMAGFLLPTHLEPGEKDNVWRFLLAVPAIFNVIRLVNLFFFLKFDTPFQLVSEKREHEAKMVLSKIYKENVDQKYQDLVEEVNYMASESKITLSDLFGPKFRKAFLLGVVVSVIEQACGVNVVYMFSNTIFETGLPPDDPLPKILTTFVGFLALVFTVMAYFWLQRRGRKPLMVIGLIAMGIVDLVFAAVGYIDSVANPIAKLMILVWIAFFTWSFGSVMFLYLSECLPDKGFSVTILLNWILAFVVVQVTMNLAMWIGFEGSFLAFGLLSFFGAWLIAEYLIESRGKTKLQILKEYCEEPLQPKIVTKYLEERKTKTTFEFLKGYCSKENFGVGAIGKYLAEGSEQNKPQLFRDESTEEGKDTSDMFTDTESRRQPKEKLVVCLQPDGPHIMKELKHDKEDLSGSFENDVSQNITLGEAV